MPEAAAVIPAYNAASTISELVSRTSRYVHPRNIFIVDDGSSDSTDLIARELGVWVLKHTRRRGKGTALRDGCMKAVGLNHELVITLDSDLQHDPDDIPAFLEAAVDHDVVVGRREISPDSMPFHRFLSNTLTSRILTLRTGQKMEDSQCGFRLYRSAVLKSIDSKCRHFDYESDMLVRAALKGYRIGFIPVRTIYNKSRSSIRAVDTIRFLQVCLNSYFIADDKIRIT